MAFLTAYLEAMGEDLRALEHLLVDCELANICFYGMDRKLPPRLGGKSHGTVFAFRGMKKTANLIVCGGASQLIFVARQCCGRN